MALVTACTGFNFGTTAGWATGNTGNKIFDAITGTPTITTSNPRTGTYALEISASAATEAVAWDSNTIGSGQNRGRVVTGVYFPTSLPAADVVIAQFTVDTLDAQLRYNNDTGKLAVAWQGSSEVDGPSVSANTWYMVEMSIDVSSASYTLDWWVDTSAQAQATVSNSAGSITGWSWGTAVTSQTYTARFDDTTVWTDTASIAGPKGKHKVVILTPDTGGSLDVSTINTAEWQTFAGATPTLSAWNATTALGAVDEIPVGLGASADGFCRITGTDADFVGIPMTSYTLAAGESVAAARMLACCWAASATTCTHSFASYNGTTATTLLAAADINTDNSSTAPAWVCKMLTLADVNTQGEIDALQFRFGCTDSTPDAGIHAIYAEFSIAEAVSGDVTATPAVITTTAALARPAADVVAGPAVTAGTVSTPAPTPNIVAGPGAVAAVVSLPQAQAVVPDVTVVPAVITSTVGIARPDVNVVAGVSVLATTLAHARPDINVVAGPAVVVTTVTVPRPDVNVVAGPVAIAALAALARPNVNVVAGPAVLAAVVGLDRPLVNVVAGPTVLAATVSLARPDINIVVGVSTLAVVVALPAPAVPAGGDTMVSPGVIAVVVVLTQPAVGVTVTPGVIAVVAVVASLIPPGSGQLPVVSSSLVAAVVSTGFAAPTVTASLVAVSTTTTRADAVTTGGGT